MTASNLRGHVAAFAAEWALWTPADRVLVAVSGGADSVTLLRLLHGLGLDLAVAHIDHGLRGPESDADAAFVRALAEELGLPVFVERVEVAPGNVQAAARAARYAAFGRAARAAGASVLATAHHADDLAETVLMQLARGAGPGGLGGVPVSRPLAPDSPVRVVRPLLAVAKADLAACAEAEGWAWREDASNTTGRYRRNRVRHRLLPALEEECGDGAARRMAAGALEQQRFVRAVVEPALAACADADARLLRLAPLAALAPPVRRAVLAEALRRWQPGTSRSRALLDGIEALVDAPPGRRAGPCWRERDAIRVGETPPPPEDGWAVDAERTLATPWGALVWEPHAAYDPLLARDACREVVDAAALAGPLRLRPWRAGDRLQPLGLGGSQLVSDLLTGRKVPPSERARQLVLVAERDGGEAIVWVVGHRLDERARITPETRRTVGLRWRPRP